MAIKIGASDSPDSTIYVHKNLICNASPFFRAACKDEWKQSEKSMIELPDDEPEVFEHFIHWLYTDQIDTIDKTAFKNDDSEGVQQIIDLLVSLYVFADKVQCGKLKDEVLDRLMDSMRAGWIPTFPQVEKIYSNTAAGSKLRRWIVDVLIATNMLGELVSKQDEPWRLCPEFFYEIAQGYADSRRQASITLVHNRCAYHEHSGDAPCPTKC